MTGTKFIGPAVLLVTMAPLLFSCGGEVRLVERKPFLEAPREITMPSAWVGYPARSLLEIRNTGNASGCANLLVDRGVEVAPRSICVSPGGTETAEVLWLPEDTTEFVAKLSVIPTFGQREILTLVRGLAAEPPDCAPSAECHSSSFNPTSGTCDESPSPGGDACDPGPCMEDGVCIAGRCLGQFACDDGDPCTADVCMGGTCSTLGPTSTCPPIDHSCLAPICVKGGCGVAAVPDGTECAPTDCAQRFVCRQRTCVSTPGSSPDGTRCHGACGAGFCQSEACVESRPGEAELVFDYQTPQGYLLPMRPPLVINQNGTVFWVETDWKEYTLVAANRGGVLFRFPFPAEENPRWQLSLLTVGDRVVAQIDEEIIGFSAADGRVLWRTGILTGTQLADCAERHWDSRRSFMAVDQGGKIIVAASCPRHDFSGYNSLIQTIDRDGSILELYPERFPIGAVFVDKNDRRYVVNGGSFRVVGDPTYAIDLTQPRLRAPFTADGKAMLSNCDIIDLEDGRVQSSPISPRLCSAPVVGDGVGAVSVDGHMEGFQLSTASKLWELEFLVGTWMNSSGGVVTGGRSVVAIHGGQNYDPTVFMNIFVEVAYSGHQLRSCGLDGHSTVNQAIAIHDGALWAVGSPVDPNRRYENRVFAIRLPGATESEIGWPSMYGGKEGHRRER